MKQRNDADLFHLWQRKRKEMKTETTGAPTSPGNCSGKERFEPIPCKLNKEQLRRSRAAEHSLQMHFLTRCFPFVTLLATAWLKCQSLLADVEENLANFCCHTTSIKSNPREMGYALRCPGVTHPKCQLQGHLQTKSNLSSSSCCVLLPKTVFANWSHQMSGARMKDEGFPDEGQKQEVTASSWLCSCIR